MTYYLTLLFIIGEVNYSESYWNAVEASERWLSMLEGLSKKPDR